MKRVREGKRTTALTILVLLALTLLVPLALADHRAKSDARHSSFSERGGGHEGNEATGEAAAWLLGAANLPVLLSLLIKGERSLGLSSSAFQDRLAVFNRRQKKALMWLHYLLNPIAVVLAFAHFSLSHCRSTMLPEIGLMVMIGVAVSGLVFKFKLASPEARKTALRIHTNPLLLTAVALVLVVGHSLMD